MKETIIYDIKNYLQRHPRLFQFIMNVYYKYVKNLDANAEVKPKTVAIESTNICNAACVFCPHGDGTLERAKAVMTNEVFFNLVDQAKNENMERINFGGLGEFLVDKNFLIKAKYVTKMGLDFNITTNAMLLKPDLTDELKKLSLKRINISIDSLEKETYEKTRVKLNFETVKSNIDYFLSTVITDPTSTIEVCINSVLVDPDDPSQTTKIYEAFEEYLDSDRFKINFFPIHNWGGALKDQYDSSVYYQDNKQVKIPCQRLFSDHLNLRVDGNLSICCEDYNNYHSLGSVIEHGYTKVWNNKKIKALRKLHIEGKWDKLDLCRNCADNNAFKPKPFNVDRPLSNMKPNERPWFLIPKGTKTDHHLHP
jgi:hypothetical protein